MVRSSQSVLVKRWVATFLSTAILLSGTISYAQPAPDDNKATTPAEAAEAPVESAAPPALKFTPDNTPQKIAQTNSPEAQPLEAKSAPVSDEVQPEPAESATNASGPVSSDTSTNSSDGKELAQNASGSVVRRTDPMYNRLPTNRGSIQIRKQFKLFAREELIHNLSFRDTPVREVIAELARRGNLNILLDKSVVGKITGDLHDVTLNEAMDSVLASAGLMSRILDNNTVIVGSPNAMTQLGLNRQLGRVFKLSYASPYEVAALLHTSVFNRGVIPDFQSVFKSKYTSAFTEGPKEATQMEAMQNGEKRMLQNTKESKEEGDYGNEYSFASRIDTQRTLKGSVRSQVQEGTGFNNAAQDPGTQQIRAYQDVTADYTVEQNGGGAIVIPDFRNRQVIVIGTPDDLQVAEECIHLIDRRPRQVHIQVSLVELTNSGLRQLGASVNLQGEGASGTLLGGSGAPLVNLLPGLGSSGVQTTRQIVQTFTGSILPPALTSFTRDGTNTDNLPTPNTTPPPSTGFNGLLGNFFPAPVLPTVAGLAPASRSSSAFNFLTLGKSAGGRNNIATVPAGLNMSVNLLLQTDKAKLLANPSVVVTDNTEALVTLASEVIHKVTSTVSLGVTNVNVELTKAGIFLDVLPRISEDGFITMRIRPQVSAPAGPRQTFANEQVIVTLLNIREIMAQEIRVKDGQTLSLGGLFTEQEVSQISKVPYLAETPLFGALFRNTIKGRTRTELLLMITPKIVEDEPPTAPVAGTSPPAAM